MMGTLSPCELKEIILKYKVKKSLQIFGIWLNGKLERSGALEKYEPVTHDTFAEYGNNKLIFYKISDQMYYMEI